MRGSTRTLRPAGAEPVQGRPQRVRLRDRDRAGQRGGEFTAHLAPVDEQRRVSPGLQHGEGQRDRGVADVSAAQIEQPGDRIERAEDGSVGTVLLQRFGNRRALGGGIEAGEFRRVRHRGRDRRCRLVGPNRIDRVVVDRGEPPARLGAGLFQPRHAVQGVQPRVVAEGSAGEVGGDPAAGWLLGQVKRREAPGIDLVLDLEGVAPVDEDRRLVREHHGEPGRAGEPRQPGESLRPRRDELALVLVGQRYDEAVQPAAAQLFAQGIEPFRRCRAAAEAVIGGGAERRGPARPERDFPGVRRFHEQAHPVGRFHRHRGRDDTAQESLFVRRKPVALSHLGVCPCPSSFRPAASPARLCSATQANATPGSSPAHHQRRPAVDPVTAANR